LETDAITLYHSSTRELEGIDAGGGKPFRDFGRGFYAMESREAAAGEAIRLSEIESRRLERIGAPQKVAPWVYELELDAGGLAGLDAKRFGRANGDWARFVASCRSGGSGHGFDAVIGPAADGEAIAGMQVYLSGGFGDADGDEAVEFFLKRVRPERLPVKYLFATQRAAGLLALKGRSMA
jgi:hypothetical protein